MKPKQSSNILTLAVADAKKLDIKAGQQNQTTKKEKAPLKDISQLDESIVQKFTKISEKQQQKIFISNINGYIGRVLVEQLRNDHVNDVNPHIIMGTLSEDEPNNPKPRGCSQIIEDKNIKLIKQQILESDIIIYDIEESSSDEIEFVNKILRYSNFEDEKIFILISTCNTWTRTISKSSDDIFVDKDYNLRRGYSRFEVIRNIENSILDNQKPNLQSYVICSGYQYGQGESKLYKLFRQTYTGELDGAYFFGQGNNRLPLIHVKDLGVFVNEIIQQQPQERYLIAVDEGDCSQIDVAQQIALNLGSGKCQEMNMKLAMMEDDFETLYTNLRFKCSVFPNKIDFEFNEGFCQHASTICQEFTQVRELRPIKLVLIGQPGVGKTYYAEKLADSYKVSLINVTNLINEFKEAKTDFGQSMRDQETELKQKAIEQAQILFEAEKAKKKGKKGPEDEFDANKVTFKYPEEVLKECLKLKLEQQQCLIRGFVLEGYPRTLEQLQELFQGKLLYSGEGNKPDHLFYLDLNFATIQQRLNDQKSAENQVETQFTEERILRRQQVWKAQNMGFEQVLLPDSDNPTFENKCLLNLDELTEDDSVIGFIDQQLKKDGDFKVYESYKDIQNKLIQNYKKEQEEQQELQKQNQEQEKILQQQKDEQEKQQKEENSNFYDLVRADLLHKQEQDILNTKSQHMRQYLLDLVVPYVSEGIINIVNKKPEEPIQFLIQFLQKKAATYDPENDYKQLHQNQKKP